MSNFIGQTRLAYARVWHQVDLSKETRTLGRLASSIALTLMGKHKPIFDPANDCGDYVVVTNCNLLKTSGNKLEKKVYRSHSGRPGHLKEITMKRLAAKKGFGEILRKAVSGMLPKNRLRQVRLERLRTFEGATHPFKKNIVTYWAEEKKVIDYNKLDK
ncbi:Mrpl23 [Lipomyces japonicus]|uniref:mitochondrial 54S ribosomal protein uL13m n=1 Tax=Lipomyces japonicus TaxID=56871 RepID=UPI0034CD4E22